MANNKPQDKLEIACHFDQLDDCKEAGSSAMHGAIAEKFLLFVNMIIYKPQVKEICRWYSKVGAALAAINIKINRG